MGAAAATVLGNAAGFAVMIGWLNRSAGVPLRSLAPGRPDVDSALHALRAPWRVGLAVRPEAG
jgi:Na+-driven multidrug efflux pump